MEKKCKHCAMMIPKEAKICPHCRKAQGITTGVGCMVILAVLFGIGMVVSLVSKQQPAPVISGASTTLPAASQAFINDIPKEQWGQCRSVAHQIARGSGRKQIPPDLVDWINESFSDGSGNDTPIFHYKLYKHESEA